MKKSKFSKIKKSISDWVLMAEIARIKNEAREEQTFEKKRFSKFSLSSVFEKNDTSIKNLNSESVSKINHEFSSSDLQKSWKKLIKDI